jgi:hypothetical protein
MGKLTPAAAWLFVMTLIFALLTLSAGTDAETAFKFGIKSFAITLGFLLVALNAAFVSYPAIKSAQKYFFFWGLALLVFMALFYQFRYMIFFALVGFSFIKIFRKKLYNVS